MPRVAAPAGSCPGRPPRALVGALVAALAAGAACDEKFQNFLVNASNRQAEKEAKEAADAERKARKEAAISPEVRAAIRLVRDSDYDFIAIKGNGGHKRYSGVDFAAMLENKSRWLGRGLDALPVWLDEIGTKSFFGARSYLVRLPDGKEMNFRTWLEAELAALPTPTPSEEKQP